MAIAKKAARTRRQSRKPGHSPVAPAVVVPPVEPAAPPVRHALDVDRAVSEIRQTYDEAGGMPKSSPFFFIIGAGVSYPSVPLAGGVIAHCRSIADQHGRRMESHSPSPLEDYSHWFSLAYPNPRQRQKYLRGLIDRSPISLANLRLAQLLQARALTNLVVTTNFDDYLVKALRLFGDTPAVCDHPRTVARIDAGNDEPQIVHVHGSYLFYDCANLREEVTDRALPDESSSLTIRGLLDSVLWTRSPLVVGYSGWEGDVIMSALKRRLVAGHPLAQSIYWFCYSRSGVASAPEWLRTSEHVRFVLPREHTPGPGVVLPEGASPAAAIDPVRKEPTLEAREVFDDLIQAFRLPRPDLFEDPFKFFADQLEKTLPRTPGQDDLYSFGSLVQRVRLGSSVPVPVADHGQFAQQLDRLRAAMQSSKYRDAIQACAVLVPDGLERLSGEDAEFVLTSAALAGEALLKRNVPPELRRPVARALMRDRAREELTGEVPASMIVLYPSRVNQMAFETHSGDAPHGAFTSHFVEALREPKADTDHDGLISMTEALSHAGERILAENLAQTPVVVNPAADFALFAARDGAKPGTRTGTLRALLVGVSHYRLKSMRLLGCANDVRMMSELLGSARRRRTASAETTVLLDRKATVASIRSSLRRLVAASRKDDVLFFYFTGHGAHGSAESPLISGLVTWEVDENLRQGLLPVREVIDTLSGGRAAHRVVLID